MEIRNTMEKDMVRRASLSQYPITGTLELLPLCNMKCDMCYIRMNKKEVEYLGGLKPVDFWIQLGKEMAEAGVLFLLLTGGEPLLFPEFKTLYIELKKLGMILTINTNGTLLDEEWADFFAQNPPRRINITLYGADEKAYEDLCHYPGGYFKAKKAIKLLKERNIDVKINGSVTKENYKDMDEIYRIGNELGVPVHMDTYMLPGNQEREVIFEKQARLLPEDAARVEVFAEKKERTQEEFYRGIRNILDQIESGETFFSDKIMCLAGNCSFAINWKGEMRPCVTFETPAISVDDQGFLSTWKSISKFSKELRISKTCAECPLRCVCNICPACAKLETGRYDQKAEYICRYTKELVRIYREEWSNIK